VEGVCYDTLPDIKSAIFGFYKSLFTESEQWRPGVEGLSLPMLQASDKDCLELPFSEEEVSTKKFLKPSLIAAVE